MSNVTLQPSDQDAYVDSGAPTNTYGTVDPDNLIVGEYNSAADRYLRTLIQFDLSSIPSVATITLATLSLYYYAKDTGTSWSNTLATLRVTSSWNESTVTWNTTPSVNGSWIGYTTCTQATSYGWVSISLSASIMTAIINGTYTNYGFMVLDGNSNANNAMKFYSSEYSTTTVRPKLYLEYTLPSGSQPAISPFFNFFKNFENPWKRKGGIWQPNKKGLVTI